MPLLPPGDDKRSRIFEAAVQVFARDGYHGANVGDIAKQAGVAKGTIYNYFSNKATLFQEMYTTIEETIWAGIESQKDLAVDPIDEARKCFVFWCQVFYAFGEECPLMVEVWSTACCHPGEHEEVRQCLQSTYERTQADMIVALKKGKEMGLYDPALDVDLASRMTMALFDGLLLQVLIAGHLEQILTLGPAAFERLLRTFLKP